MSEAKKNRRWVVRAIVIFLIILGLLTFFSNTIMNATIPKVSAEYAAWGNLSFSNNASAPIDIDNKTEVKGIEGRKVEEVLLSDYDSVSPDTVVVKLVPIEESEELQGYEEQLEQLEREKEYESRTPSNNDYSSFTNSISSCELAVEQAEDQLEAAENKDSVIDEANDTIADLSVDAVSLQASVDAASATVEDIQTQISELNAQKDALLNKIEIFTTMGTPTPTPTPIDSEPIIPVPGSIEEVMVQLDDIDAQLELLESELSDAQSRLDSASADLAEVNLEIADCQAEIAEASLIPSVEECQNQLNQANSALSSAQTSYSNQLTMDGITADKEQDAYNDREEQIADLEEKIAELTESINITEITAGSYGYLLNVAVSKGDVLTEDAVIFNVIPDDAEAVASFTFSAEAVAGLSVGMELTSTESYWYEHVIITSIKPNPNNPRNERIVKCSIEADYIWPGEMITVIADRSNQNYDNIVPASAVNEDNAGTFVYILEESNTPLGQKFVVRRLNVTVENTDGTRTAISADELTNNRYQIVTRSEEPLQDGDRVRLADYSK